MAQDFAEMMNRLPGDGWVKATGLVFTRASVDEVACEWDVTEKHLQGYGIVHGGVHCGVIETLASVGAHLVCAARGQRAVGLENHTSFIRAVRTGRLRALAKPVTRGRTTQVWEAWVRDAEEQVVAHGTVRLLCLPEDKPLAGALPGSGQGDG
jgi:1,4-dihydroxy-2-naphthoyl-CoA hydrolase